MLSAIHISNFALIQSLELDFQSGLTVITGETGAGKSIVIDALGLALGERADHGVIRHGAEKTDITAEFEISDDSPAAHWLADNELDHEGVCILRRVVARQGRAKCFINGRAATLSMLRELGDLLVDIHGQHAHQSLLKPNQQLQLLNALGDSQETIQQVAGFAKQYRAVAKQLDALKSDQLARQEKIELLQYQVAEMEGLDLSSEAVASLEQQHTRNANLQTLQQTAQRSHYELLESDYSPARQLAAHLDSLTKLADSDDELKPIIELLQTAATCLDEGTSELASYAERLESDPESMQLLDQQLAALHELSRKHRVELSQLGQTAEELHSELNQLTKADQDTSDLEQQLLSIKQAYHSAASTLSANRAQVAQQLEQEVAAQMSELGMSGGRFGVKLIANPEAISVNGAERVEFEVSANPGSPMQPLAKVASGGEISRISLAIQVITARKRVTPTLIFDEVDVGIGGQTADTVGRMLSDIAQHAQVISVTHQPQVAARAEHHLNAAKQSDDETTTTAMARLDKQQRIDEIARMVGGKSITDATRKHARELING